MTNLSDDETIPSSPRPPMGTRVPSIENPSNEDDPDEIRVEIIQTRAEMSETLGAIQERLDPDHLKAQARDEVEKLTERLKEEAREEFARVKHEVRAEVDQIKERVKEEIHDATIGKAENLMREIDYQTRDVRNSLLDRVRDNPIPAALAGVGLAWLFLSGPRHSRPGGYYPDGDRYGHRRFRMASSAPGDDRGRSYEHGSGYGATVYEGGERYPGGADWSSSSGSAHGPYDSEANPKDRERGPVGHFGDQIGSLGDQVQNRVRQVGGQVQSGVQQIEQQVQDQFDQVSDQVQDRFQDVSGEVQTDFTRARWMAERAMRENPLAVGVMAVAMGAAVGMMVPETPQEDQLLGPAREQFVQRAGSLARDAIENVQERVQPVASPSDRAGA